jgi:hypothetical protein
MTKKASASCPDGCGNSSAQKPITCKLTSPEMQQRKATVIASLKKKIIVKGDGTSALLTITGPKGAKDFIKNELEL